MSDKKQRMAGDKLANAYSGEDEYGSWGDTWDNEAEQQQLRASGNYDSESDLAKKYAGMKENISSRVDDEEGWRQLKIDGDLKDPKKYADLVNKWSDAGFDVRAIDMADGFHSSNIAVRIGAGKGTGVENPVSTTPEEPVATTPTPSDPAPTPGPSQGIEVDTGYKFGEGPFSQQIQNIQQDNDINSTVTGNNNVVTNTQDNSNVMIGGNSYGGDAAQRFTNDYIKRFIN